MKQAHARGYTVVELMMSLAVFATGVTGVIAMERATVSSNQEARNVAIANAIAESWLSQLAMDATTWSSQNSWNLSQTVWLSTVAANDGNWQLPAYSTVRAFGAQFDGFGAPTTANPSFCAQIRLSWIYNTPGNGLIRTEVRVFWPRDQSANGDPTAQTTSFAADCTTATQATVNNVANGFTNGTYHVVMHAGAVRQLQ